MTEVNLAPDLKLDLELIRNKRLTMDITLQEMASALGLKNASSYLKYESGEYKFNAEQLPVVCKMLGLGIVDIFFDQSFAKSAK